MTIFIYFIFLVFNQRIREMRSQTQTPLSSQEVAQEVQLQDLGTKAQTPKGLFGS